VIPFRDENPSRSVPVVTRFLIALNVALFLYEISLGEQIQSFLERAAVLPRLYTGADLRFQPADLVATFAPDLFTRLVTAMFLHGGLLHLAGNLLYLWIFGDNIEDRLGRLGFTLFYVFSGIVASWGHIISNPASRIPSIGASGAIAGVLGAYVVLYPRARVLALLPLGFFSQLVRIPAVWFLGFWFAQQFLFGLWDLGARASDTGGTAWWAHIGGFGCGILLGFGLRQPEEVRRFGRPARVSRFRSFDA
jgi:membrane associated rhomboid family serine protease